MITHSPTKKYLCAALATSLLIVSTGVLGNSKSWKNKTASYFTTSTHSMIEQSSCSRNYLEASLESKLSSVNTDTDFSFYVENAQGDSWVYHRGTSTLDTVYKSASTSKWVSAAVILQLVDQGVLKLTDRPQDYLNAREWNIPPTHALYDINLSQLLSFTSGLSNDAACANLPNFDFFRCIRSIGNNNRTNGETPGTEFNYSGAHLQVAGAMAIRAAGHNSWSSLFNNFKTASGLFANSSYNLPSHTNPRLAGGMSWTARDYIEFIRAYKNSDLYSSCSIVSSATSDQLNGAAVGNSPILLGLNEDWHYGYGLWAECHNDTFNCVQTTQVSSPAAYGAYPFLNLENNYFGIVARQGALGTFTKGYAIYDSIRNEVEAWALCDEP